VITGRISMLVAVGAIMVTATGGATAAAAAGPTVAGEGTVAPSADYATEVLGNPFDYADRDDALVDGPPISQQVTGLGLVDGQLRWRSSGGNVTLVQMTVPGGLPDSRDGVWNPIDANRYPRIAMRLWASTSVPVGVQWFGCTHDYGPCLGHHDFWVQPGWNLIDVDLRAAAGSGDRGWAGQLYGVRLASGGADVDLRLDWLRFHAGAPPVQVTSSHGQVYWDVNRTQADNDADGTWGPVPPGGFPAGAFPPGEYHLFDGAGTYGDTITVVDLPRPVVHDPDVTGGDDYATTVLGNPWDFDEPGDVVEVGNAVDVRFADGALHATNGGAVPGDPHVKMAVGPAGIDAARYHRLTVTADYDGPFDLGFGAGGGTHGRVVFWRADSGTRFHDSRELVTFTTRPTVTYDLRSTLVGDAVESGSLGWDGTVTHFRWDPNEDPGPRRWRLHDVRLAADDEAHGRFRVRWSDAADAGNTTVRIGLDTDRAGHDGEIAAGIPQRPGENVADLDLTGIAPGTYWVWVEGDDGRVRGGAYATGPLVVTRRLAGPDRIETAATLSRIGFPDGAETALIADAHAYPDALAAAQLAAAADAPLLLNPRAGLAPVVRQELARLGVSEVLVLGGAAAQSETVMSDLRAALPGARIDRVSGADRFATAAAVADEAVARWTKDGAEIADRVLLASGTAFPDALAASQLVAAARMPLLLTAPTELSAAAHAALDRLDPKGVVAVGGPSALHDAALAATGRPFQRLSGPNRYATAVAVADAAERAGATASGAVIALGEDFPDALGAGALVARRGAMLVLVGRDVLPGPTADWLAAHRPATRDIRVVGGRGAISDPVAVAVATAAG
jgi:putative cell wall-binding protein